MRFSVRRYILIMAVAVMALFPVRLFAAEGEAVAPRLVVNIVIGALRSGDLERYSDGFTIGGFNRLGVEGIKCRALYSYGGGSSVTSLSTFATGALPATHGVVGGEWFDRVSSELVDLVAESNTKGVAHDWGEGSASPKNLVAQTFTESLREARRESKSFTVALDAASAVAMNGRGGDVVWIDPRTSEWASSTAYMTALPKWIERLNSIGVDPITWQLYGGKKMVNRREFGVVDGIEPLVSKGLTKQQAHNAAAYDYLTYTPAGNRALLDMAWSAVQSLELGRDEVTDVVNISLDTAQNIMSQYGPESMEVEDMYYRLDRDLERFIDNVRGWVEHRDVLFVVTSAGGASPSYDSESRDGAEILEGYKLFNAEQFAVILNTFLGAKYGAEQWVLGYRNRAVYLNHNLIYQRKLRLEELQSEVADFALQFRGVSHAVTASALRGSYFADGFGALIQRSFYPRRSGDVVINLMSGWIEERDEARSMQGSGYRYDREVPLLIMGSGITSGVVDRELRVVDIAPTVARVIGIKAPMSAEGEVASEIVSAAAASQGVTY
ncbi:MAG: alkaline phosphatase family protein [Rikenellaceae bacterium]